MNPDYKTSEEEGVGNMTMLIKEYGDACPDGKMVLMGYSQVLTPSLTVRLFETPILTFLQGAQVVGDTLIGADESLFNDDTDPMATPLATKYLDQIVAIIMMGDPAHVNTTKFNVGNATNNGYFPRNNSASFDTLGLTPKMQSYCNSNDTYCDNGSSSLVHASYTFVYGAAATKFVVDKVQTALNGTSESGSTLRSSSATSTAAPGGSSETATSSIAEATGTGSTASSSGGAIAPASGEASSVAKGAMGYLMTGVLSSAFVIALYL